MTPRVTFAVKFALNMYWHDPRLAGKREMPPKLWGRVLAFA